MKTTLATIISAACLGICALAQAQTTDSASTGFNHEGRHEGRTETIEESQMSSTSADTTEQTLEEDVKVMQENFEGATIDKVGPNGEALFRERGKYFYINEDGKKIKVKKSDVRDKSEESEESNP